MSEQNGEGEDFAALVRLQGNAFPRDLGENPVSQLFPFADGEALVSVQVRQEGDPDGRGDDDASKPVAAKDHPDPPDR